MVMNTVELVVLTLAIASVYTIFAAQVFRTAKNYADKMKRT
ncbi:hypothetical protein [Alicyclobacillus dauci]|uniref:Uncharacterized protein n=1 Tax=Alicyclobacillus dauci TaxID=1475485 RepID=A0ABY6YZX4_9BACL|nr:hypothetical protein [Alicyclobacillus dauci]WAH36136.1 hypothetical protein NZD86_18080 [Alicyclobacillus dauci]